MMDSLALILRCRREQHLIADAEIVRGHPDATERLDYARRLVREAMLQCVLGNISQETESRVFTILAFAMPIYDGAAEW
jgi:hypothetical protein